MKQCGCSINLACGCCEGTASLTPQATANRPGLSALRYRIGTHSAFFETMVARLSNSYIETTDFDSEGNPAKSRSYPLKNFNTRAMDDPSIALLDASAMLLDVLTFYQERIVNEGYLKTATERRSILELARLVGYTLRPGVAASVYLAYTMDDKSAPVEIPVGARSQSIPSVAKSATETTALSNPTPPELPQSFETSEKLEARKEWNDLKPRATRPQKITSLTGAIYFEGTETNLKPNDPLLFVLDEDTPVLRKVKTVEPLFDLKKTKVTLQNALDSTNVRDVVLRLISRYQSNFESFCLDSENESVSRAAKLLGDARTAILDPTSPPQQPFAQIVLKLFTNLKDIVDKSGNARMQNWFAGLVKELRENLEPLSDFNEFTANTLIKKTDNEDSVSAFSSLINLTAPLSLPPSKQPANSLLLGRNAVQIFDDKQDTLPHILTTFNKDIGTKAYQAWANTTVTEPQPIKVFAFRVTSQLFGNSVPPRFRRDGQGNILSIDEHPIVEMIFTNNPGGGDVIAFQSLPQKPFKHESEKIIYLDSTYEKVLPDSWVVVDKRAVDTAGFKNFDFVSTDAPKDLVITRAANVSPSVARFDYDFSGKTTRIELKDAWIKFRADKLVGSPDEEFRLVRQTVVHAQSEQLELADEPIGDDVCGGRIELGVLYDGLRSGRWIIVSGERTDIPNTTGVKASELVMLSGVEQTFDENLPGDKIHSTLILANRLAYTYKRDTVRIYGNVVKATHGETRSEVLGSGNAAQAMQSFTLKQPPLTYVSAPTTSGIESTLVVRVNDIKWKEVESLAELTPQDRNFTIQNDDEAKTTVIFGNGENGARLPTGVENVRAVYRNGIGKSGNVEAEQITLLMTKPLGLKEVVNPLRSSGGADKETRDQARRNVPVALMALDRLVSTKDYADFARTFAGIGKASAARLSDGRRQVVHLTIAGADDIPIDLNSDLYNNLRRALAKYGDSFVPVQIAMRELLALVIVANVQIQPDYLWESVEPKIRTKLLDTFSFDRRELGQPVFLSEVISIIQAVKGVRYVDVDILDSISETDIKSEERLKDKKKDWIDPDKTGVNSKQYVRAKLAMFEKDERKIMPAQLAFLTPDVSDTLILNKIEEVKK